MNPRAEGMVTAEAALVLPLIAIFALALVWLLSVGIAEVMVVDAARDAARAVARGDSDAAAVQAARRTAGAGALVHIRHEAGLVTVRVVEVVHAPGWLPGSLPGVTVSSQSRVETEDAPASR